MNSKELMEKESQVILGTYKRFPVVLEKGQGARVWDKDGKEYLDFLAGIAVNSLGHNHPKLTKALNEQIGKLMHISNLYYNEVGILLADLLIKLTFPGKVFYCNSGTEANEAAIKLARKYGKTKLGGKTEIITTLGSFHGRTLGSLAATAQPKYQEAFQPLPGDFVYVPYNDLEAMEKAITSQTCAIMVEPIQGEGGVHPAQMEYLQGLRDICQKNNILLILDEVQTGIGRTGKMFAYQHYGIEPDVMTLAKGLGGGFPLGAMLVAEKYTDVLVPGDHGTTFGGNPLACRAALTTLETILEEKLVENALETGAYFFAKLQQMGEEIDVVRGKGLMVGIDLKTVNAKELVAKALEKGLILNATGDKTVRFVPPLIVKKEEIDQCIAVLQEIIEELKEENKNVNKDEG